jgi:hypothetical protein
VSTNLNKKIGRSRTRRPSTATTVLVASATAIVVCSFYFIDNLDAAVEAIYVSQTFIAMIIIPIASNAPKASTLITARALTTPLESLLEASCRSPSLFSNLGHHRLGFTQNDDALFRNISDFYY